MFEIGTTLRDARVRRNISLQQAEEDTKIRVKYIQAMENEDFGVLPGGTYVKGFLRTYAEYLDLDYQVVLDEFNDRFGTGDHREHLIQPPRTAKAKVPRKRQNYILVAVLAVAIIAVLAYLGWGNSSSPTPALVTSNGMDTTTSTTPAATATAPQAATVTTSPTQTQPSSLEIAFEATSSNNWIAVYKDSGFNEQIWSATLSRGDSKTLGSSDIGSANQVWLKVGSVTGLVMKVNGKTQQLTGMKVYKVTPGGVTPVTS